MYDFSIVLPYLSNSECIDLCKKMLHDNSKYSYELIEIIDCNDVYYAYNEGVKRANTNIVILINDDMFVSKNWDEYYIKYTNNKNVCTGYLVEPGVIGVSHKNIKKDFGKTPEKFNRIEFENWAMKQKIKTKEYIENQKGWYMPISFNKDTFIEYPNESKFPTPNDIILIDEILPSKGYNFLKINSYVYHLQNFSNKNRVNRN